MCGLAHISRGWGFLVSPTGGGSSHTCCIVVGAWGSSLTYWMGAGLASPAGWGSEPGRGSSSPAARRRCSPPTTRRWPSRSAGSPSAPPAPCSTASPPPGSCDATGPAPPRAPAQSRRSGRRQKKVEQSVPGGKSVGRKERHLQQAVTVDQQVPGFDVAVQNPRRVQVLQTWTHRTTAQFGFRFSSEDCKHGLQKASDLGGSGTGRP